MQTEQGLLHWYEQVPDPESFLQYPFKSLRASVFSEACTSQESDFGLQLWVTVYI